MRYYGTTYKDTMIRKVAEARDSVGIIDYSKSINGVSVNQNRQGIKNDCAQVAAHAHHSIYLAQQKFDNLITLLEKFYTDVDDSAEYISKQAEIILELLNMVNGSMQRINDALNETGEYEGTTVTAEIIEAAGVDEEKCIELEESWEPFIDNEKAVAVYIENIEAKIKRGEKLSEEEIAKINEIYNYYVDNRGCNVEDYSDQELKNCIAAYEIINPNAKKTADEFFGDVYENASETEKREILRIKYALYTADPQYRDTMLFYLDNLEFKTTSEKSKYKYEEKTIYLNFSITGNPYNYCAFFHELGHAIDDLAYPDTSKERYISKDLNETLIKDFENSMDEALKKALNDKGIKLTDDEKRELYDFILSPENINVSIDNGTEKKNYYDEYAEKMHWTSNQKDAFIYLRNYYGYLEYTFRENDDFVSQNYKGSYDLDDYSSDIIGGVTNNLFGANGGHPIKNEFLIGDYSEEDTDTKKMIKVYANLKEYNYYFTVDENGHKVRNNLNETEFFAENFEYKVLGKEPGSASEIFPNGIKKFESLLDNVVKNHPIEPDSPFPAPTPTPIGG